MNPTLLNPKTNIIATPNANVTPEQQSAAIAQGFTVPTAISAKDLTTNVIPYNLPPIVPKTTTDNLAVANNSAMAGITNDANYTPPVNTAKENLTDIRKTLGIDIQNQANDIATINNDAGLLAKKQKATQISTEIDAMDKAYRDEVAQVKANGIGGTLAGQQDVINKITDRYQNNRANVALVYKVAAEDYNGAQEIANQKIQSLKDTNLAKIELYKLNVDAINNDLTESEKMQVQANLQAKQKQADTVNNAYADVLKGLSTSGQNVPASIYSAVDTAARQPNATPASIYAAAGSYMTNTLDTQYKQAQITKMNADAAAAVAADATVNPDVLQGMLNVYKSTGVLPAFGMSAKSPLRAQFYAALGADGSIVTDANTNKTIRNGLSTAYRTQQNILSANETAIGTLDQQLSLAKQYSDSVSRSGSPLVAKYVLGLKSGVFGDPDAAALNNIVKTASYEFAKILSGSAASIAGVTVSSAADAESMLNISMSKGQFNEVVSLMQKEAQFRIKSQRDTLAGLEKDLNNIGSLGTSLKNAGTIMLSPDGTQQVNTADLTPIQIEEAKNAGWK